MNIINFEAIKQLLDTTVVQVGAVVLGIWVGAKVLKFAVVRGTVAAAHGVLYLCGWRKNPSAPEPNKPPYYEGISKSNFEYTRANVDYYARECAAAREEASKLKEELVAAKQKVITPLMGYRDFRNTQNEINKEDSARRHASLFSGAPACTFSGDSGVS